MAGGRIDAGEYAHRVNMAAELLEAGVAVAEVTRICAPVTQALTEFSARPRKGLRE